jgi:tight adherence protein B
MMTYIFIGAIAIGIGGMIFAVSLIFQGGNEQVEDRLAELTKNGGRGVIKQDDGSSKLLRSPLDDVPNAIEEFANRFLNLRKFIEQSGVDLTLSKFVLVTGIVAGVAGVACFAFSPWKSMVPIATIGAAVLPLGYVWWKRKSLRRVR